MNLTKAVVLPIASAVLVVAGAGAVLAAAVPGTATNAAAVVPAAASSPAAPAATSEPVAPYLKSVLDPLVAKGTINASQEAAIIDAWAAKRTELQAERKQLRSFLSDGVLTADELAQLPADSPFQQLKPLMTNGQITVAQLRALGNGILRDLRLAGRGGARALTSGAAGASAPTASPTTGG